MSNQSSATMQGDLDVFHEEMLKDLPMHFPDRTDAYVAPPIGPMGTRLLAEAKAARERRSRSLATHAALVAKYRSRAANDDAVPAGAPSRSVSKKSKIRPARPRRSLARDKRVLPILEGFAPDIRPALRERAKSALVSVPPTPPISPSTSSVSPKTRTKEISKREAANENDKRKPPAWRYTTDIVRGHAYIRTISTRGAGLSWSLNLGGKVLQAANDDAPKFMREFQDRLAHALKVEFGAPRDFMFGIETTTTGRPHLHGAADALIDERERLEAVLRRVGGPWDSERHREHQAHTDELWAADGWLRYIEKDMNTTKARLGLKSVLSVTRGCRSRAEVMWEVRRARSK